MHVLVFKCLLELRVRYWNSQHESDKYKSYWVRNMNGFIISHRLNFSADLFDTSLEQEWISPHHSHGKFFETEQFRFFHSFFCSLEKDDWNAFFRSRNEMIWAKKIHDVNQKMRQWKKNGYETVQMVQLYGDKKNGKHSTTLHVSSQHLGVRKTEKKKKRKRRIAVNNSQIDLYGESIVSLVFNWPVDGSLLHFHVTH